MFSKTTLKNSLFVLLLMGLIITPYLLSKRKPEFNPLLLKLNTQSGPITLKELKDKKQIVLMYFGFLSCPDVCPTTLSLMARVFKEIPKDKLDHVTFIFVDLDPERDKLSDLKNYTDFFDTKTIPVSLNLEELDLFTRFFGIAFMKVKVESEMGYTIDHSTDIVVLSPNGELLEPIHHDMPKTAVVSQLNKIINQYYK